MVTRWQCQECGKISYGWSKSLLCPYCGMLSLKRIEPLGRKNGIKDSKEKAIEKSQSKKAK